MLLCRCECAGDCHFDCVCSRSRSLSLFSFALEMVKEKTSISHMQNLSNETKEMSSFFNNALDDFIYERVERAYNFVDHIYSRTLHILPEHQTLLMKHKKWNIWSENATRLFTILKTVLWKSGIRHIFHRLHQIIIMKKCS